MAAGQLKLSVMTEGSCGQFRRCRLLVITSEPLHPLDTFSSTFELAQCALLTPKYDVAVLSVSRRPNVRGAVREAISYARTLKFGRAFRALSRLGAQSVLQHNIRNIPVYEGLVEAQLSGSFDGQVAQFVEAGLAAYAAYRKGGRADLVHAHGRFLFAGALANAIKDIDHVPYVYQEHSSAYARRAVPAGARDSLLAIVGGASKCAAVSAALAREFADYVGVPSGEVLIVPNAISGRFEEQPLRRRAHEGEPFTVACIASLNANKRVELLIEAFAIAFGNSSAQLLVCGAGPEKQSLAKRAFDLGISKKVRFLGQLAETEIIAVLDDAHVLVVSSQVETFSVVAAEALLRGRPVVATRCGGPEEFIHSKNGILLRVNTPECLAEALTTVRGQYERFDQEYIRADAIQRFGGSIYVERLSRLYGEVLAAGGSTSFGRIDQSEQSRS